MSVADDRSTTASAFVSPIADPAPLGLAAFALTTFLLSAKNAGWMTSATGDAFLGYALAYGGLAQLLAGMWEFRNRNVFGATAFSTYGGFWIGLGLWVLLVARPKFAAAALLVPKPAALIATAAAVTTTNHDLGWILLAFAIFNTYMLLWSTQVNAAVFGVFLTLEATEIILFIGNFLSSSPTPTTTIKVGGYVGVVTAAVAWYASAALISRGMGGRLALPVGRPLIGPPSADDVLSVDKR
ncbi:MAG TPA: acetate uptake transporter [Streptosporangiaceae bacterium]|nr:acetate uptake transporter [Streptosporangiaceae bacterium]